MREENQMKPSFIFAIVMLTTIVMISSFNLQIAPGEGVQIPADQLANALYVCPAASQTWDSVSVALRPFVRYIMVGFFFAGMILMFSWGWALYQNLLKDEFNRKAFTNPWGFTKIWFWAIVVILLAVATPNYFKTVRIRDIHGEWVLCERDTPGAKAVKFSAVTL